MVGSRDCTNLVAGVTKQVDLVRAALARDPTFTPIPVTGMLCFVEADWPIIGGSFVTGGVDVLRPKKAVERITGRGDPAVRDPKVVHRHLAASQAHRPRSPGMSGSSSRHAVANAEFTSMLAFCQFPKRELTRR